MEEIKTKKKLNKKPLIICLVLALVFGIVGFVDIKSNATESGKLIEVVNYLSDGSESVKYSRYLNYTEDYELYWYAPSDTFYNGYFECFLYVVSKEHSGLGNDYDYGFVMNGETYYVTILYNSSTSFNGNGYIAPRINGKVVTKVDKGMYHAEFVQNYMAGNIKPDIDYDNLITDFEIPVIENIKVNRIKNWVSAGLYNQYFDYVTWSGSDKYNVQVKKTFSVYFTRKVDFEDRFLGAEYNSSTMQDEILDIGCSSFTQQTDMQYITDYRQDDFNFYSNIRKNTDIDNWDKSEICFCYAIRYIDVENNKAGPWCYVLPSQNIGDFEQTFTCSYETEDGSFTENFSPDGTNESFKDFDEIGGIDNAKDTIDAENDFKDKYEIVDGNADTQEVMNWLNTVVSFIKGTPSIVTSVLSFLPQPILYGMYITIFLGCIASAIAIIKALI